MDLSPDGSLIVIVGRDGLASLWNTEGMAEVARLSPVDGASIELARFTPDGSRIVTRTTGGDILIWAADVRGEPVRIPAEGARLTSLANGGGYLMTVAEDGSVARIWSTTTGELSAELHHDSPVRWGHLSADGQRAIVVDTDNTGWLWTGTGTLLRRLGEPGELYASRFSPSGSRLLTFSPPGDYRLWDADGRELPLDFESEGPQDPGFVRFGPDEHSFLAYFRHPAEVRLWNQQSREYEREIPVDAPSGRSTTQWAGLHMLRYSAGERSLRVWSPSETSEPVTLHRLPAEPEAMLIDEKATLVVTLSEGEVHLWPLDGEHPRKVILTATRACLDPEAREWYLNEDSGGARAAFEKCEIAAGRPGG